MTNDLNRAPAPSLYQLAGLRIASGFPIPGLAPWREGAHTAGEISIAETRLPAALTPATKTFAYWQFNENEFLLRVPGAGRFLARSGREILVEPENAIDNEIYSVLLGTAFGMLCHQRGIVPLHAAAIDVEGGCVAFVGDSGAGKSTLAAALGARGYHVVSDDVCYLEPGERETVRAWPGVRRMRLWDDSVQALSLEGPAIAREAAEYKFLVPIDPSRDPVGPRRLLRIYQLETGDAPHIAAIAGADALEALLQNVYRVEYAKHIGRRAALFRFCTGMARDIPVFRFVRPMGFDVLQSGIDLLIADLRGAGLI